MRSQFVTTFKVANCDHKSSQKVNPKNNLMNKKLFRLIVAIVSIILLASCYSAKKAHRQVAKAIQKHPLQTAEQLRDRWPLVPVSSDTVNTTDTLFDFIEVECPPNDYEQGTTIVKEPVYVRVPQMKIRERKEVTIRIKDSATVFICEEDLNDAKETIQVQQDKIKSKNKTLTKLWIFFALVMAYGLFKLYRFINKSILPI